MRMSCTENTHLLGQVLVGAEVGTNGIADVEVVAAGRDSACGVEVQDEAGERVVRRLRLLL